jgi:clan AA aspartic protease (TIGR02281 family)
MEKEGGVYNVPCKVNGVEMRFIFDSGAAKVCISEAMADYLYHNGYITLDDIKGIGQSQVADGRIVENVRINLRDIEIAGMHLHNVEGVVILGLKGSLLLGQSAIQALGRVTIDGNRLIIHNATGSLSEEQIEYLRNESTRLIHEKDYHAALVHLRKLYNSDVCTFIDLYGYAYSLSQDKQYDEALIVTQKWFDLYEMDAPAWMRYGLYLRQSINYFYKVNPDYRESINWAERDIYLIPTVFENEQEKDEERYTIYQIIGRAYFELKQYRRALETYEKAFNLRMSYFDCRTPKDIKKIKDQKLGNCAYAIATCYHELNDYSNYSKSLAIAARLGNESAIIQCKKFKIKF